MLLTVNDIRLVVRLGNTDKERAFSQQIAVDIRILFASNAATETDNIADTICYDQMVQTLKQIVATQEFHLIEKLTKSLYDALFPIIASTDKLTITVHKLDVPISEVHGAASFIYP